MTGKLIVRITHGPDDAERAISGLTVATAALASGVTVEVWLMNEGVRLALPGVVEELRVDAAPPGAELWNQIAEGARVFACGPCLKRRGIAGLRDGVTQAGAAALVGSVIAPDTREMVF